MATMSDGEPDGYQESGVTRKENFKNASHYQEITFSVLEKLIEEEAKKGNSKWYLTDKIKIGQSMINFFVNKGFRYYCSPDSTIRYISW